MSTKKTIARKFMAPNGATGQEFRSEIKAVTLNLQVQTETRLVSNPGKKDESSIVTNAYDTLSVNLSLPINSDEQWEKALADNPVLVELLPALEEVFQKRFSN